MAGKYEQYVHPCVDGRRPIGGPVIVSVNSSIVPSVPSATVPGSNFYFFHWVPSNPNPAAPFIHPPHIHKDAELVVHIGTDPDDPGDLGAEIELYMGEELKRYEYDRSTVLYIPAGVVHGPWRILKTTRPWIVLQIAQGHVHTEKFFPNLVPEQYRDKVDWNFWQDHGFDEAEPRTVPLPEEPGEYLQYVDGSQRHSLGPLFARFDSGVFRGSNFYNIQWVLPGAEVPLGHPPHVHDETQLLFFLGTDMENAGDLGAEVEIFLGPEMERYVINQSRVVQIPAGLIHGPWRPLKTKRPWLFVEVNEAPARTETLHPEVLPPELRERVDWSRWRQHSAGELP